jgi:hypothetical protein
MQNIQTNYHLIRYKLWILKNHAEKSWQHRLFEHCKVQKMNHCAICRGVLINLDEFLEHNRNHNPIGDIHCIICRQSIRGDIQLRMHGEYHLDIKNNQFGKSSEEFLIECSTCNMVIQEIAKSQLLGICCKLFRKLRMTSTQNIFCFM